MNHQKCIIIGGGPAGYTAAIYAARAGLEPLVFVGMEPGGQLMITTDVENYPGFVEPITGPDLMAAMRGQAERVGARIVEEAIEAVDFTQKPLRVGTYTADAVIIATGAKARWLGLPSETAYQGRGVSACATCDGFFFRGQDVAVIGGGNSAVEEALFLSNLCRSVTLIHRRDTLRAEKIMQERLFAKANVSVRWNAIVAEIVGDDKGVIGVRLDLSFPPPARGGLGGALLRRNPPLTPPLQGGETRGNPLQGGETRGSPLQGEETISVSGVFVAIGHTPATDIFKGQIPLDKEGYSIVEPGTTRTSIPGVFAAGDVADKTYRQAVTAAGMGCMAALEVEKFLTTLK